MKQLRLVGDSVRAPYEVHEHCFISGPRCGLGSRLVHSHEGGEKPHQHPNCGPASYTIDKDEWAARTGGVKGGTRKKFSVKPSGEQLPWQELEDWQKSFEVVYLDPPPDFQGHGGGHLAAARMVCQFRMTARVIDGRKRRA